MYGNPELTVDSKGFDGIEGKPSIALSEVWKAVAEVPTTEVPYPTVPALSPPSIPKEAPVPPIWYPVVLVVVVVVVWKAFPPVPMTEVPYPTVPSLSPPSIPNEAPVAAVSAPVPMTEVPYPTVPSLSPP